MGSGFAKKKHVNKLKLNDKTEDKQQADAIEIKLSEQEEELINLIKDKVVISQKEIGSRLIILKKNGYMIKKYLASGSFGYVLQVNKLQSPTLLAVKIIEETPKFIKSNYDEEVQILKNISQNKICFQFFDQIEMPFDKIHMLVTEYGNDSLQMVMEQQALQTVPFKAQLLLHLSLALKEVHKMKILHSDIKPDNILVFNDQKQVKLIDFGLSQNIGQIQTVKKINGGSLFYSSPEVENQSGDYDLSLDVYSMGIIFLQIVSMKQINLFDCYKIKFQELNNQPYIFEIIPEFQNLFENVIRRMLEQDPKQRMKAEEVYNSLQNLKSEKENVKFWNLLKDISKKQEKQEVELKDQKLTTQIKSQNIIEISKIFKSTLLQINNGNEISSFSMKDIISQIQDFLQKESKYDDLKRFIESKTFNLPQRGGMSQEEYSKVFLRYYMQDGDFYKLLQLIFSTKELGIFEIMKPVTDLLCTSLQLFDDGKDGQVFALYKIISFQKAEFEEIKISYTQSKLKKDQQFLFFYRIMFASGLKNLVSSTYQNFQNNYSFSNDIPICFIIQVDKCSSLRPKAVNQLSYFQSEDEYIIPPFSSFEIKEIGYDKDLKLDFINMRFISSDSFKKNIVNSLII